MMISGVSWGKNYEKEKKPGLNYDVSQGIQTDQVLTVEDKTFEIYKTDSGIKFIKAETKSGRAYPVWIGEKTNDTFEGNAVYRTRNNNYCIFELSKAGYPRPVFLDKNG